MKIKTILLLTAITTTAILAEIPNYNIIPLGKLTDNPNEETTVWSINDAGQIVGNAESYRPYNFASILYRPGQYDTAVNLIPNGSKDWSYTLNNNSGQIMGIHNGDYDGVVRVVIYDETGNGDNTVTQLFEINTAAPVLSINDLGQIPGNICGKPAVLNTSDPYNITVYQGHHNYNINRAFDVNNAGTAVGYARDDLDNYHAMLFEKDRATELGTLGGTSSYAVSINNLGQRQ